MEKRTINLKEVAQVVLSKFPYDIVMEQKGEQAATEKTEFYNLSMYNLKAYGANFQNIPVGIDGGRQQHTWAYCDYVFIDTEGNEYQECNCIPFHVGENQAEIKKQRENFKLKESDEVLLIGCKVTTKSNYTKETKNGIYFFSKPYTPNEINELRDIYFNNTIKESVEKRLPLIETIWK